jgi:hypothetical protein
VQIIVTKHARKRFKERVIDVPYKLMEQVIRHMLAQTVDYQGRDVRTSINKRAWLHPSTGTVFVVNLSYAQRIQVITVVRPKK